MQNRNTTTESSVYCRTFITMIIIIIIIIIQHVTKTRTCTVVGYRNNETKWFLVKHGIYLQCNRSNTVIQTITSGNDVRSTAGPPRWSVRVTGRTGDRRSERRKRMSGRRAEDDSAASPALYS